MARTYKRDASGRFAGSGGGGKKKGGGSTPKTTSARGRARSQEAAARQAVKAGGGTKATRSLLTAQRARDFYKATGTGTKRSPSKASSGSKPANKGGSTLWKGREGQAVRTANRVAGKLAKGTNDRSARGQVSAATARRASDYLIKKAATGKEPAKRRGGLTSNANLVAMRESQARMARKANPPKPAKMSKAPVNKAKQAYRAATSRAREARMLAGGATTTRGLGKRTDAGAQNIRRNVKAAQAAAAKVRAMERSRGVSKPRKRK
jgi:hypothetical protein